METDREKLIKQMTNAQQVHDCCEKTLKLIEVAKRFIPDHHTGTKIRNHLELATHQIRSCKNTLEVIADEMRQHIPS